MTNNFYIEYTHRVWEQMTESNIKLQEPRVDGAYGL